MKYTPREFHETTKAITSQNKRYKFYIPDGDLTDILWDYADDLVYEIRIGEITLEDALAEIENKVDYALDFMWENYRNEFKFPYRDHNGERVIS